MRRLPASSIEGPVGLDEETVGRVERLADRWGWKIRAIPGNVRARVGVDEPVGRDAKDGVRGFVGDVNVSERIGGGHVGLESSIWVAGAPSNSGSQSLLSSGSSLMPSPATVSITVKVEAIRVNSSPSAGGLAGAVVLSASRLMKDLHTKLHPPNVRNSRADVSLRLV